MSFTDEETENHFSGTHRVSAEPAIETFIKKVT